MESGERRSSHVHRTIASARLGQAVGVSSDKSVDVRYVSKGDQHVHQDEEDWCRVALHQEEKTTVVGGFSRFDGQQYVYFDSSDVQKFLIQNSALQKESTQFETGFIIKSCV